MSEIRENQGINTFYGNYESRLPCPKAPANNWPHISQTLRNRNREILIQKLRIQEGNNGAVRRVLKKLLRPSLLSKEKFQCMYCNKTITDGIIEIGIGRAEMPTPKPKDFGQN